MLLCHLMLPQLVSAHAGYQRARRGGARGDSRTGCGSQRGGGGCSGWRERLAERLSALCCRPPGMAM